MHDVRACVHLRVRAWLSCPELPRTDGLPFLPDKDFTFKKYGEQFEKNGMKWFSQFDGECQSESDFEESS